MIRYYIFRLAVWVARKACIYGDTDDNLRMAIITEHLNEEFGGRFG